MPFFLLLLLLSLSPPASALLFQSPVGFKESLLGNTGVGLPASPGNSLFNPAGMAFFESKNPNFSVGGSLISSEDSKSNLYSESTNSLTSRSLLTSGNFPISEEIRMSAFYSFPANSQFYGYNDATENSVRARQGEELTIEAALGGIAYSGKLTHSLAWGFSASVLWLEQEYNATRLTESTGQSSLTSFHEVRESSFVTFTPSLMWRAAENYTLGLSLTASPVQFFSNGTSYTVTQDSGSTTGTEVFDRSTPEVHGQLGASLGQNLELERWQVLFDVNYFAHDPLNSEEAWQGGFGLAYKLQDPVRALAGFNYLNANKYYQYIVTGGAEVTYHEYEFVMGLTYQSVVAKNDQLAFNGNSIGFIFSSSMTYDPK